MPWYACKGPLCDYTFASLHGCAEGELGCAAVAVAPPFEKHPPPFEKHPPRAVGRPAARGAVRPLGRDGDRARVEGAPCPPQRATRGHARAMAAARPGASPARIPCSRSHSTPGGACGDRSPTAQWASGQAAPMDPPGERHTVTR